MIKILLGVVLTLLLIFKVGPHSESMAYQLKFEMCNEYRVCCINEWVDCNDKGYACKRNTMYAIITDNKTYFLRFLGVNRCE